MKVELKLFASLKECLPASTNGMVEVNMQELASPQVLVEEFNIPLDKVHLLLVNGVYVDPAECGQVQLHENDVVAMWPPIAGGLGD
jgi:molybdopterin converting factor small subunit